MTTPHVSPRIWSMLPYWTLLSPVFGITLHGLLAPSLTGARSPWSWVPAGMKIADKTRDIYGTILFHTYGMLIQSPSIDPHNKYRGLQGLCLNPYLTELLTHGDQIAGRKHWRTHLEIDWLQYVLQWMPCAMHDYKYELDERALWWWWIWLWRWRWRRLGYLYQEDVSSFCPFCSDGISFDLIHAPAKKFMNSSMGNELGWWIYLHGMQFYDPFLTLMALWQWRCFTPWSAIRLMVFHCSPLASLLVLYKPSPGLLLQCLLGDTS